MDDSRNDADEQAIVAYTLGELDEPARLQLEQRLADEPELAAKLAAFEAMDLLGAALAAGKVPQSLRSSRRGPWTLFLLAAALALLALWLWPVRDVIACEVRAVASPPCEDTERYAEGLDLPEEYRHPIGERRGVTPTQAVSLAGYLAAADARERERSETALAAAPQAVVGDFFTLRFRVDRECSAMVLQLDSAGGVSRRYPARPEARVFGEAENRFTPGPVHVLPRPIALVNAIGTISLLPGFDVPSDLPLRRTWLVLAVRAQPIGPDLLADTDAFVAGAHREPGDLAAMPLREQAAAVDHRLEPLLTWLQQRGFTTRRVTIDGG